MHPWLSGTLQQSPPNRPVAPLVDRSSPEYDTILTILTNLGRHILDVIATSESTRGVTWIFTDASCTSEVGSDAVHDYADAARKRGVQFIPLLVTCDREENERRVAHEDRGEGRSTKMRDVRALWDVRIREEMYLFRNGLELELDVSSLSPLETAQRVAGASVEQPATTLVGYTL
ncbi:hypothetical protein GE09DRAFT_1209748 [Coniochaeta sp. 2T2.1]|nr:hypothetical protein GE09DRAFT_1209748 [Coniochaeta sp. 2T2.1]